MPDDINSRLDVNNCDREPIHIPGTVQPFGTLLAGSPSLEFVDYAGANLAAFTGIEATQALASRFDDILGQHACHDIRNILSFSTATTQRERVGTFDINDHRVEIFAHLNPNGVAIVELEEADSPVGERDATIDRMRVLLAKAANANSVDALLLTAARGLYLLTGYNRVKAYRFAEDGSGEVVAEARDPDADSLLGLRYPAWDIPKQARALQVKNPVRMLSDVTQTPVAVLARESGAADLDLSLAHTRGISPIHVQYLKNMGVSATMTLSLVIDGALWGMFALHHMSPKVIGSDTRIAAELFSQMISLLIKEKLESEKSAARTNAAEARNKILARSDGATDLLNAFGSISDALRGVIRCDGLAVMREHKLQTDGAVPPSETIGAIAKYHPWDDNLIADTEHLEASDWHDGLPLNGVGGCMIIRATAAFPLQIMFFREERSRQVRWAGQPKKELEDSPFGQRITPRGSFAAYLEEQKGRAAPWDDADRAAAREIQIMLTQLTARSEQVQMTRHKDLVSHQRQQDLMIAELNHRVKNILALIRSLSRQAKESSASLESYAKALEQRISALAAAHDLAVSDSLNGVSLRSVLETEVNPYQSVDRQQVLLSGPLVGLRADVAPMIALVFHEVVTNAAKYGALSTPEGIVQIQWEIADAGLQLSWRELSGPPVTPPKRHGFGRSLIERAIPYEFDGTAELTYDPTGVRFRFTLPPENLVSLKEETPTAIPGGLSEIKQVATGKTILMVEDNVVLAMDMVETLTRLGANLIETASTVDAAMVHLNNHDFDVAVLDMNLRGVVAFDIADRLIADGVPFLFVTGYGSKMEIPAHLRDIPILSKPVNDAAISDIIGQLLHAKDAAS